MIKLNKLIFNISIIIILLSLIFSMGIINAQFINEENLKINSNRINSNFYDEIDQFQKNYTFNENQSYDNFNIYYENDDKLQWCAQSFKPNLPILSKVRWCY